jgi:hypothetical protein
MAQDFATVVEDVKQLSTAEKEELQELLRLYLIEERSGEIHQHYEASLEEVREGSLTFSRDTNTLREVLSHEQPDASESVMAGLRQIRISASPNFSTNANLGSRRSE